MIDKLNKINTVSFASINSDKGKKTTDKTQNNNNPQQDEIISKNGAKALRNAILGLAALGAASMAIGCDDDPDLKITNNSSITAKVIIHPHPVKADTVYITVPGKNDTITVVLPADTVKIKDQYQSDAADSLVAHGKNLGFDFDGDGNIPIRINAFDQWNLINHDMVLDGSATSEETMVFIDEAKDYSKSNTDPIIRYNRVEFSVDDGRGIGTIIKNSPTVGVKPSSALDWQTASTNCLTNLQNGFDLISKYDDYNDLSPVGTLEKSNEKDVSFYQNLFVDENEIDSYSWSDAKMTLADPEK